MQSLVSHLPVLFCVLYQQSKSRPTPFSNCTACIRIAESGDIKASVAVLSFILSSAAKHNVESESLSSELQQLGLPKGESDKIIIIGLFTRNALSPYAPQKRPFHVV